MGNIRAKKDYDPKSEIISPRHLVLVTGLASCTIWRMRREGTFPEAIRLSKGRIGFRKAEIEEWLNQREKGFGKHSNPPAPKDDAHTKWINKIQEFIDTFPAYMREELLEETVDQSFSRLDKLQDKDNE